MELLTNEKKKADMMTMTAAVAAIIIIFVAADVAFVEAFSGTEYSSSVFYLISERNSFWSLADLSRFSAPQYGHWNSLSLYSPPQFLQMIIKLNRKVWVLRQSCTGNCFPLKDGTSL